jgi:hypothetical protein
MSQLSTALIDIGAGVLALGSLSFLAVRSVRKGQETDRAIVEYTEANTPAAPGRLTSVVPARRKRTR